MLEYDEEGRQIDIKRKHLDLTARTKIETMLNSRFTSAEIARALGVSEATISYEIHSRVTTTKSKGCNCARYEYCKERHICNWCNMKKTACRNCAQALKNCKKYTPPNCGKLSRLGLCNGCLSESVCTYTKQRYFAKNAQDKASNLLHSNRRGARITRDQLRKIDEVASRLLLKGQSPQVILHNHPELNITVATLYNYIRKRMLKAKIYDLRRVKSLKTVSKKYKEEGANRPDPIPRGHNYYAFCVWRKNNPNLSWVEMDCVETKKSGSGSLLTLYFYKYGVQIARWMPDQTISSVIKALDQIEEEIGTEMFKKLFPVILTDRGSEFRSISGIENSCLKAGKGTYKRTRSVFYCDPMQSNQKAHCERNHEFIRVYLPEGTDFALLMQEEVDLMMNHINSLYRESKNRVPIEAMIEDVGKNVVQKLHLKTIHYDDVTLHPDLLKNFHIRTRRYYKDKGIDKV